MCQKVVVTRALGGQRSRDQLEKKERDPGLSSQSERRQPVVKRGYFFSDETTIVAIFCLLMGLV